MPKDGAASTYTKEEKAELMEVMAMMRDGGRNLKEFKQQMDAADLPSIPYSSLNGGETGWQPEKMDGEKLSPLEMLFIKEFTIDYMPVDAVNRVKKNNPKLEDTYKILKGPNAGFLILKRPHVLRHLKKLKAQALDASQVNIEYVLSTVTDVIERCKQARQVFDREGNPVTIETEDGEITAVFTFDATNVLKGADMLGKWLAMWTEKKLLGSDPTNPLPTNMPTKKELKEALKEAQDEIERDY